MLKQRKTRRKREKKKVKKRTKGRIRLSRPKKDLKEANFLNVCKAFLTWAWKGIQVLCSRHTSLKAKLVIQIDDFLQSA